MCEEASQVLQRWELETGCSKEIDVRIGGMRNDGPLPGLFRGICIHVAALSPQVEERCDGKGGVSNQCGERIKVMAAERYHGSLLSLAACPGTVPAPAAGAPY
jgi:hypothetical protein